MNPIPYRAQKIFCGKVSIRSPVINQAKTEQRPIEVYFKGDIMTILASELDKGTTDGMIHKSKYDGTRYTLIDFPFRPNNSNQKQLI